MSTAERTYELTADEFCDALTVACIALTDALEREPVYRHRVERCLRVARSLDAKFGLDREPPEFARADAFLAGDLTPSDPRVEAEG